MAKVLVVEDETAIAKLLEHYLGSFGHAVMTVDSGTDSLRWLSVEDFDLVVMDVLIDGPSDGLEVCRMVKGAVGIASPRVLIISGLPGMEDLALAAGADAFLAKPFRLEDVKYFAADLTRQQLN
ncbi:MAG TPA: response regulator [Blastocatellia bacterium]|nr:response regulator [Blastocatellia bacterium]